MADDTIYPTLSALVPVEKLLAEAGKAIQQPARTMRDVEVPEVLGAIGGIGAGAAAGWGILAAGAAPGAAGAAALSSGLATAGAVVGGGMAIGVAVVAAPAVVLGVAGFGLLARRNKKRLTERKQLLLQEAIRKNNQLLEALRSNAASNAERFDYLTRLVAQLRAVVDNLRGDLQQT
jgi:hypothetical protein